MGLDISKVTQFKLPQSAVQSKEVPTITQDEHAKLYHLGFMKHDRKIDTHGDFHYYIRAGSNLAYFNRVDSILGGKDDSAYEIRIEPIGKDFPLKSHNEVTGYFISIDGRTVTQRVAAEIEFSTTDRDLVLSVHDEIFERLKSGSLEEVTTWLSGESKYKSVIKTVNYIPDVDAEIERERADSERKFAERVATKEGKLDLLRELKEAVRESGGDFEVDDTEFLRELEELEDEKESED